MKEKEIIKSAELLVKVKEYGERWNSSLTRIGEMLCELADWIDENLPENMGDIKFHNDNIMFWRYGPQSNIGRLGPTFWWTDDPDFVGSLLSTERKPGSGFYLHGDFNTHVTVAPRWARREAAEKIYEWLNAFVDWLKKQGEMTEEAEKKLERLFKK